MKVKVLIKTMNNLDRTKVYQYSDTINTARIRAMKKAKSNPYESYEFSTIQGKYLGFLMYRKERKDYIWVAVGRKNPKIGKKVSKDGSLGEDVKLW